MKFWVSAAVRVCSLRNTRLMYPWQQSHLHIFLYLNTKRDHTHTHTHTHTNLYLPLTCWNCFEIPMESHHQKNSVTSLIEISSSIVYLDCHEKQTLVLCCYFPRRILYYFQQIKNSSQQYLTHKAARLYPSNRCYNLHIRSHSLRNIWRNLQCVTDMHLINSFLVPLDQATFPYDCPRPIDCWKETQS